MHITVIIIIKKESREGRGSPSKMGENGGSEEVGEFKELEEGRKSGHM